MKRILPLSLSLLMIFTAPTVKAQLAITATVSDDKGMPIPGATAFLTNTKHITVTNADGKFKINNLPTGSYDLAVKMMGYLPSIQTVILTDKSVDLHIKFTESNGLLKTVNIVGKVDRNRKRYLEMFVKNFIGQSTNASQCKILNPEVIVFHYDEDKATLTAGADEMLVIENLGLGYKINYLLTRFATDAQCIRFYYSGYPYFEELAGSPDQQKKWDENRKLAYAGSSRRFYRGVFNHTAEAEGFNVFTKGIRANGKKTDLLKAFPTDSLFEFTGNHLSKLKSQYNQRSITDTTELYVVYKGGSIPKNYTTFFVKLPKKFNENKDQLSIIQPVANNVLVDRNGTLFPANSFYLRGLWAFQKISELTPMEYDPEIEIPVNK